MKKTLLLALPLALAACQPAPQAYIPHTAPHGGYPPSAAPGTYGGGRFLCDNGMEVSVQQLDNASLRLTVSGDGDPGSKQVVMQRGVTGEYFTRSGLYGGGGEWRGSGAGGTFAYTSYDGRVTDTHCRVQ